MSEPSAASRKLRLALRKRLPPRLRAVLRLSRAALAGSHPGSPDLPPELVEAGRLLSSRMRLPEVLPHGGVVAEIGTLRGAFARRILDCAAPRELHLVDLDFGGLDPSVAADPRVVLHEAASEAVLAGFPDASFDWIYIDADHSYDGVVRDARAAAAKVKPGGYLVFNDFAHVDPFLGSYGVHRAVTEFALERRWPIAWLAYERFGLYDVALRRPEGEGPGTA